MLFVLFLAACLWGIGHLMKAPISARLYMLGLLYVAVLAVQLMLPDGHPLREATGGSPALWLLLGGAALMVLAYRSVLVRLKARADVLQEGRTLKEDTPDGPLSGAELERYARHITLPDVGGGGQVALKRAKVLVVGAGGLALRRCSILRRRVWGGLG